MIRNKHWAIATWILASLLTALTHAQPALPSVQPLSPSSVSQSSSLQTSSAQSPTTSTANAKWVTFSDCPVILENRYIVSARESGIIEAVVVESNTAVKRDQLLLSLESDEAKARLDSAKENHATAVDLASDDGDLKLKKLALQQAEEELASHTEISKSMSATELRKMRLAVASARVGVSNAEVNLKRLRMQADFAARAVDTATKNLSNRNILAPSDGIVTELMVRRGQAVEVGKPVMEVWDLRQLQVDCLIPYEKIDLKKLEGLDVRVESNHRNASGQPIRLTGKVTSYDPKLNARGEVRVHCRIQNRQQDGHWLLLPEMHVRLEISVPAPPGEVPALISKRPIP